MIIAVEGCAHGELDEIYRSVENLSRQRNTKVDLLICCGDFQAVRNEADLQCMAIPDKFKRMCTFYKYYSGEAQAPILTIFIGGNHEASNYLQELAYGGWVAPNIYYLGYAGVVRIGGLRIAGMSGIFNHRHYLMGHFERTPYSNDTLRSVYHVRNLEVFRLKQLRENVDVFISHDWPRGVYHHADTSELLRWKPFFRDEIANNTLGSQVAEGLLYDLKPRYWFSAHLHCRFSATIRHSQDQATEFLALDKCLPKRKFLELIEIPHDNSLGLDLHYDPHWLAILRSTNHLLNVRPSTQYMPGPGATNQERWDYHPTEEELETALRRFDSELKIPLNFTQTAETYVPRCQPRGAPRGGFVSQAKQHVNPQTTEFCEKLGIDDPLEKLIGKPFVPPTVPIVNPDEINLDDDEEDECTRERGEPEVVDDLFVIDTQPQRSKMSLPEPKLGGEPDFLESTEKETPTSQIVTVDDQPASVLPEQEQPVVKKFKRRNQELYTEQENAD